MASEIKYMGVSTDTGKTNFTAQLYNSLGVATGSAIALAEVGSTFVFEGDMTGVAAGEYGVRILEGSTVVSQGSISWDGNLEITNHHIGRLLGNRRQTNPTTGEEELMDDDGTTVLLSGAMYEDVDGATPYSATSTGARRRDKLTP